MESLSLWKLNVRGDHLAACEIHRRFAMHRRPAGMRSGDILFLQVVKSSRPDPHARIRSALVFDSFHEDAAGESLRIWGTDYPYVLSASAVLPVGPFSLEDIPGLRGEYVRQGQMAHQRILPEDEHLVLAAAGLT